MKSNFRDDFSWTRRYPEDLECMSGKPRGGHKDGGSAQGVGRTPHPCGPLMTPPTYFFRLYILKYSKTYQESHENTFHPRNLLYP